MKHTVAREMQTIGSLQVVPFAHPQGCRGYLLADRSSKEALALDVHLDLVHDTAERLKAEGWKLRYVVDTHTHADHPSGAAYIASQFDCTRMAHERANHAGVTVHPKDRERIDLGESDITVRHTPGHTPDHMCLAVDGAFFSGDSLLIGGVARTDFMGGDAGQLFDSIHAFLADLPEETILFPGHDYRDRIKSTLGEEKRGNPWLQISDRDAFVQNLIANPPPKPANMDDLLRLNREGVNIPADTSAGEASRLVATGGAASVIDVRTEAEFAGEHIPGSHLIPLDQVEARADEVMATPAPRLLFCRSGNRASVAKKALEKLHVAGLSVVKGGLGAYVKAGGHIVKGKARMSLERQVRIAAGSLVLAGVLAGFFIHPAFLVLSGFVGSGLIFAGVTDWCGMGILLGKMPWNRSNALEGSSSPGGTCAASLPGACAAGAPPLEEEDTQARPTGR
jgi:glyoxylase-like metal-dependent hydrolase (beta-lactamase superfamily II)/rhodanese-related sulfurtransferase